MYIDLIPSFREIHREAIRLARPVRTLEIDVPIIAPEFSIVLKLAAGGPIDLLDARGILDVQRGSLDIALLESLAEREGVSERLAAVRRLDGA